MTKTTRKPKLTTEQVELAAALAKYGETYRRYLVACNAATSNLDAAVQYGCADVVNMYKGTPIANQIAMILDETAYLEEKMAKATPVAV